MEQKQQEPAKKKEHRPSVGNSNQNERKEILSPESRLALTEENVVQKKEEVVVKKEQREVADDATEAPQNINFPNRI